MDSRYVAILAGETRAPGRSIGRSVVIAAPIIALMFVLGTSTVVAYIPTDDASISWTIAPGVLRAEVPGPFSIAGQIVTAIAILMTLAMRIGAGERKLHRRGAACRWSRGGTGNLLPAWFCRLHSKYQTPVNSIVVVGVCSFGLAVVSLIGVGQARRSNCCSTRAAMFARADARPSCSPSMLVSAA